LSTGKKAKFGCGQILLFAQRKNKKSKTIAGGNWFEKSIFSVKI
jgi:hypothetical protein